MKFKVLIEKAALIYQSQVGLKGKSLAILMIIAKARDYFAECGGFYIALPFRMNMSGSLDYWSVLGGWKQDRYSSLSMPVGLMILRNVEERWGALDVEFDSSRQPVINFLIPNIDPKLIFGGYIAVFNFMKVLLDNSCLLRIIICDPTPFSANDMREACKDMDVINSVLTRVDIVIGRGENFISSPDDEYIAYSWLTARVAINTLKNLPNKKFGYFIQEFEAIFHPYDSLRALCTDTYNAKHYAIFNSAQLKKFFSQKNMSVFSDENEGENDCVFFRHALTDVKHPTIENLSARKTKKVLLYARPEQHNARNLFELSVLSLKEAISCDVFDEDWEFYGIGSLALEGGLDLGRGRHLKMMKKMPLDEYTKLLSEFDIGVSPMYAPHPSVPPLEMARAGLVTVTTTFENRSKSDMEEISGNLIATEPTIHAIVDALREAVKKRTDFSKRVESSFFDWPVNWLDSFNDDFLSDFDKMITLDKFKQ